MEKAGSLYVCSLMVQIKIMGGSLKNKELSTNLISYIRILSFQWYINLTVFSITMKGDTELSENREVNKVRKAGNLRLRSGGGLRTRNVYGNGSDNRSKAEPQMPTRGCTWYNKMLWFTVSKAAVRESYGHQNPMLRGCHQKLCCEGFWNPTGTSPRYYEFNRAKITFYRISDGSSRYTQTHMYIYWRPVSVVTIVFIWLPCPHSWVECPSGWWWCPCRSIPALIWSSVVLGHFHGCPRSAAEKHIGVFKNQDSAEFKLLVYKLYLPVKHSQLLQVLHGHRLVRVQSVWLPLVLVRGVHVPGF